ncbi:MAG: phage virion morphogenesis protein [Chitinophagaceae bacterium]
MQPAVSFPYVWPSGEFYRDSLILAGDISRFGENIRSMREPFNRAIREVIIPSIKKNFAVEGRPAWQGLEPSTVISRGSAHPILQRKRNLLRKATQINIWSVDKDSAAVTGLDTRVKYAKYHQGGTRNMPQRVFMILQDEDQDEIENIFQEWIVERSMRDARFRK